ncbi:NAD(P)H-binding protein [Neobacillus dielmonensis]|uniref:NAD(P)H-binding protein n=1 Tax=Neobacillus dielmonensis TaxID=1347369 RepID=UPI0005A7D788|nr:NAD(P)H-binding protein [Neobacillus dielmonensis]
MNKTALILGASGLVGKELIQLLVQQSIYQKIHILVRRPIEINHTACEVHVIDFERMNEFAHLFDVNDVYCCLGTTMKKAKSKEAFRRVDYDYPAEAANLACNGGAKRFLIITAMGANPKSLFFYNQVKGDVEEALKKVSIPSIHIFRPSLLLGKRDEFRFGEKMAEKASGLFNAIMLGPLKPFKAIKAKQVAAAMISAAIAGKTGVHIHPSNEIETMAGNILKI